MADGYDLNLSPNPSLQWEARRTNQTLAISSRTGVAVDSQFALNVRRSAEDSFTSGLYCAESVVLAVAEALSVESDLLPKAATAFCSGMGRM